VVSDVAIAQLERPRGRFPFYLTILAVLIFVNQKDEDFAIQKDEG
jgi:hypothetical protein